MNKMKRGSLRGFFKSFQICQSTFICPIRKHGRFQPLAWHWRCSTCHSKEGVVQWFVKLWRRKLFDKNVGDVDVDVNDSEPSFTEMSARVFYKTVLAVTCQFIFSLGQPTNVFWRQEQMSSLSTWIFHQCSSVRWQTQKSCFGHFPHYYRTTRWPML